MPGHGFKTIESFHSAGDYTECLGFLKALSLSQGTLLSTKIKSSVGILSYREQAARAQPQKPIARLVDSETSQLWTCVGQALVSVWAGGAVYVFSLQPEQRYCHPGVRSAKVPELTKSGPGTPTTIKNALWVYLYRTLGQTYHKH